MKRTQWMSLVAAGVLAAAMTLPLQLGDVLEPLEEDTIDLRFEARGTQTPPDDLVVVAVDDVTFDELDTRWPFPRSMHAKVIDRLHAAGAKVIAFDIEFSEPSEDPDEDTALLDAAHRARPVVFSSTAVNEAGDSNLFGGDPAVVADVGAIPGLTTIEGDYRTVPYGTGKLRSLAVEGARLRTGEAIDPSEFDDGRQWIDYRGKPHTITTIPFSRVLRGRFDARMFRGATVVVGASAPALQDLHETPAGGGVMSGPEIQANALLTVANGNPLRSSSTTADVIITIFAAALPPIVIAFLPLGLAIALSVLLLPAWGLAAYLVFDGGTIVPVAGPWVATAIAFLGAVAAHAVLQAVERKRTHDVFARFVPASVVDDVLATTDGIPRLGGKGMTATVMFSDLRGFTTFAEQREPSEVIEILNRYLTLMSDAILAHGGTLVAYMGDGIMAVFGAPLEMEDHADRALAAAREMIGPRMDRFNDELEEREPGTRLRMGVGLNTGPVMSGNVGSEQRMEYTAIGDTTNTAARIEGMTKTVGRQLLIAGSTLKALTHRPDDIDRLGDSAVRGRSEGVELWVLKGDVPLTAA